MSKDVQVIANSKLNLLSIVLICIPTILTSMLIAAIGVNLIRTSDLSGLFLLAWAVFLVYDRIKVEYVYHRCEFKLIKAADQHRAQLDSDFESKDLF